MHISKLILIFVLEFNQNNIMNANVKNLIRKSHQDYQSANPKEKQILKKFLEDKMEIHNNAIKNIGMGYAKDNVIATKIYLRYLRRYESII